MIIEARSALDMDNEMRAKQEFICICHFISSISHKEAYLDPVSTMILKIMFTLRYLPTLNCLLDEFVITQSHQGVLIEEALILYVSVSMATMLYM